MPSGGPQVWPGQGGIPLLREGFWLGDRWWHGQMHVLPSGMVVGGFGGPSVLQTVGGNQIEQHRWIGGWTPVNLRPLTLSVDLQMSHEADLLGVIDVFSHGTAFPCWFDLPVYDRWFVPGNPDTFGIGALTWEASRPFTTTRPEIPDVPLSLRPPKVEGQASDGTWSTYEIVDTTPTDPGEVEIIAGFDSSFLRTAVGITDTWLRLLYWPQMWMTVVEGSLTYEAWNDLAVSVVLQETLTKRFIPATPPEIMEEYF